MEARFVSGHRVELLVPRPPFSYHDRTECLSVPGVMRICTDGLVEAQHTGFFTANFKINGTRLYAVRQKAIYSQKLHRKWSPQNSAFLFRVSLATLGNASYSLSQQLFHPSTMEELLHSETKSVHIDPETRRPSKLPSWIVKDYHQFANHEPSLISVKQVDFIPPSDSFRTTIRTRHSDMDRNGHVHFAEFYRFCADCASEASLSGFYRHYDDELDRLSVLEIARIVVDAYEEAEYKGLFTQSLKKNNMRAFVVRERGIYSRQLHRKVSPYNSDLLYRVSLASLGTTSFTMRQDLYHPTTMEQLLHIETKTVNIHPETRRPTELTNWITEKYSQYANHEPSLISVKQDDITPPSDSFQTTIRTRHSDTDNNFHVNFAEFYRFCADCASEASLSGFYRHCEDDLCWYPVLETDVTFIGESPPSSNLTVSTWQDNSNIQRIYFAIYLKDKKILQASYLYGLSKSMGEASSKL